MVRITVGTIMGLMPAAAAKRFLQAYSLLEPADFDLALTYAAWRLEEREDVLVLN